MPTHCNPTGMVFGRAGGRTILADFDGGLITSDAGALLLGATDRAIRLVARFAACFHDTRDPAYVRHRLDSLLAQRVFGLALGYEDVLDHDTLRHDPVLTTLLARFDRSEAAAAALAGKSTLNRLEHAPAESATARYHRIGHDPAAIAAVFVDLFLDAFAKPPREIILDVDATDDPIHGHQEGRFFHGYYDCYCYLPLYVFCGRHRLCLWSGPQRPARGPPGRRTGGGARSERRERPLGAGVPGFSVAHARLVVAAPSRDRQGRVEPGRGEPALCRDLAQAGHVGRAGSLRGALLRARGHGEPHQGVSTGSVCRSHFRGHDAGQPVAAVVCLHGLRSDECAASDRAGAHGAGGGELRHDPAEASEDRRAREAECAARDDRHGLGLPE